MDKREKTVRAVWICVLLAGLTLGVYWPVVHCQFTNFDDPYYVTNNPNVLGGLTVDNVGWAFRTGYYANWHPLTWLSHMADIELFGGRAGGHHLTNLVFHTANTLLLFWVLNLMTGALGRSALVAALFAVHPLHVESVAWIAERKDVLSTFFFMLTLLAYYRYVQSSRSKVPEVGRVSPRETRRVLPLLLWRRGEGRGGPGPAAEPKPIRTPLPNPLPFGRGEGESSAGLWRTKVLGPGEAPPPAARFYLLALLWFALGLMSKPMLVTLPFVLLLLDYWPLQRLQLSTLNLHLSRRSHSKAEPSALWPLLREKVPFFALALAASVVTYCVQKEGGTTMLLGHIPLASRLGNALIAYVCYLGKMIWPAHLAVLYPHPLAWPVWQVIAAAAVLLGLTVAAVRLARRHPYVAVGWFWYLGTLVPVIGLVQVGEQALADRYTYIPMIGLFVVLAWGVWEIASGWPRRDFRLGSVAVVVVALLAVGTRNQLQYWRTGRALLEHSLQVGGGSAVIHGNLGAIVAEEGNLPEAQRHFEEALRLQPGYARARLGLVLVLAREGQMEEATRAVRGMEPAWEAEARRQLGESFLEATKVSEAIEQYSAAVRLDPSNAALRERFGLILAKVGRQAEASEQFAALVRLRPNDAEAHYNLALALQSAGQPVRAVEQYRQALGLKPDWPEALNDLAWMLATCPRPEARNGAEAVQLAERACAASGHREAKFLGTLDAAYAEAGRFPEAMTVAEETQRVALAARDAAVAEAAKARLELYRAGRPYHQP